MSEIRDAEKRLVGPTTVEGWVEIHESNDATLKVAKHLHVVRSPQLPVTPSCGHLGPILPHLRMGSEHFERALQRWTRPVHRGTPVRRSCLSRPGFASPLEFGLAGCGSQIGAVRQSVAPSRFDPGVPGQLGDRY